jgi:hypothetical protein
MKQKEAKHLVIREWDRWVQTQSIASGAATGRDSFKFFLELQDARAAFLNFQTRKSRDTRRTRDKWQIIRRLLGARRLSDCSDAE